MEIIEVSGYLTEEKVEIARRHLIPEEMKANGIFDEKVVIKVIDDGISVRELERLIKTNTYLQEKTSTWLNTVNSEN